MAKARRRQKTPERREVRQVRTVGEARRLLAQQLRTQQRIKQLARQVQEATRRADVAAVGYAKDVLDCHGYVVLNREAYQRVLDRARQVEDELDEARRRLIDYEDTALSGEQ